MNIAMLIGPLVGGLLFKAYGPQGAYAFIASLYFSSGFAALAVRVTNSRTAQKGDSVRSALLAVSLPCVVSFALLSAFIPCSPNVTGRPT